ncbi:hypothetical protein C0J52_21614 [Blattella germanica]|nr:hypothetical protein C0J52_21614 [Blattella germanica]
MDMLCRQRCYYCILINKNMVELNSIGKRVLHIAYYCLAATGLVPHIPHNSLQQQKLDYKIRALVVLCEAMYLQGNSVELPEEIPPELVSVYKYCPITSVDVERSFSAYKLILSDKRHKFTPENLEKKEKMGLNDPIAGKAIVEIISREGSRSYE